MGMVEADEINDALVFASSGVAAAVVELVLESFEIVDEAVDVEAVETVGQEAADMYAEGAVDKVQSNLVIRNFWAVAKLFTNTNLFTKLANW